MTADEATRLVFRERMSNSNLDIIPTCKHRDVIRALYDEVMRQRDHIEQLQAQLDAS